MLISFSGIDSAGKSTQIDLLCDEYKKRNQKYCLRWSKARGTPGILFLKELVRRDKGMSTTEKREYRKEVFENPRKQKLLYVLSMLDLCWYWGIHFRFLSLFCNVVICDRYLWDTYVEIQQDFQMVDVDHSFLWKIVRFVAAKPKISFMFYIPAEESLRRDFQKNAAGIDGYDVKVRKIETYMKCMKEQRWTNVLSGMESIANLHNEIMHTVGMD